MVKSLCSSLLNLVSFNTVMRAAYLNSVISILRGEKLNYKSVAKEISKPPFFWLLKSSGHQSLPCLFDSCFLRMFRTVPIFGRSRDHNRKRLKTRTEWIVFKI